MTTFIALLRGINVGKAKRVPMVELRSMLAELGYSRISTLLNSGNVVFQAATGSPEGHAADIASAISRKLNVQAPVIVKTACELNLILTENPLVENAPDHSRLLVVFTQETQTLTSLRAIEPLVVPPEQFMIGKFAAYLHCAGGILESKAGAALLGKAGKSATTRNWATVLKLQALAQKTTNNR